MEKKILNYNKVAALIRARLAARRIKQKDIAAKVGLSTVVLNQFLCRRLNLLDSDIYRVLEEIGLNDEQVLLSVDASFTSEENL